MNLTISKFGGTSTGSVESLSQVANIIKANPLRKVIVVSAFSGVTNQLIDLANRASTGSNNTGLLLDLKNRHELIIQKLKIKIDLGPIFSELESFLSGITKIRELSIRSRDYVLAFGERISAEILTALLSPTMPVVMVNTREVIKIENKLGIIKPLKKETDLAVQKIIIPLLKSGKIIIATGFFGGDQNGNYTTFTRGGSDYSASILANALDASLIEIWTDVCGIMNCDPRLIPEAKSIRHLNYEEAAELSYFGAKVLHPKTIEPAVEKKIPVKILNTFSPDDPGSIITDTTGDGVKAVSVKKGIWIINIYSTGMLDAFGFLALVFEIFRDCAVVVDVVATSEVSISITIDQAPNAELVARLSAFAKITVKGDNAVICLVGENINKNKIILSKLFDALAEISVLMVSQGASPRNLTVVVNENMANTAISKIYNSFFNYTI